MKKIYHILPVVLFVTGALLTSCNKAETTPEETPEITTEAQTIQFTATLAAKREDPQSKAITPGTEGGKEILNVAWAENEQIAVRYLSTGDISYATTTATVTAVDPTTGTATISATLTNPMDGGTVQFVYPATLANSSVVGEFFDESKLLNQHGNLTGANGISTLYDAATGSGTISVSAGTAVVSSKVTMTNRVCICKFHFALDKGTAMVQQAFNNLKIYDGNGHVYTITSDRPDEMVGGMTRSFTNTDDIYVAMLPVSGKPVIFHYEQTVVGGKDNYIKFAPNTTLAAGKFYRSLNLTLTKDDYNGVYAFKDLSEGSITAANGDYIYQSNSAATSNTITIPDGYTVTLAGVNINSSGSAGIICNGTANIILAGTNTATAPNGYPGIQAGGSGTLTISGGGTVNATGGSSGAGIGSSEIGTCGDITISGGTITANGGNGSAGIGSGGCAHCGTINVSGGNVTATKGSEAPYSIGKGKDSSVYPSTCGTITIGGTQYYDGTNFVNGGETYLSTSPFTWTAP